MKNTLLNTAFVTILTLGIHLGNNTTENLVQEEYEVLHSRATTLRDLEIGCKLIEEAALEEDHDEREAGATKQSAIKALRSVLSSPESTLEMLVPATLNLRALGMDWRTMATQIATSHSDKSDRRRQLLTELSTIFKQLATTPQNSDEASAADYANGSEEMQLEKGPYTRLYSEIDHLIADVTQKNQKADEVQDHLNEGLLSGQTTRTVNRMFDMPVWTQGVLDKPLFELKQIVNLYTCTPRVQGEQLTEVEKMEKLDRTSAKLLYIKFALEDLANEFDELIAAGEAKLS